MCLSLTRYLSLCRPAQGECGSQLPASSADRLSSLFREEGETETAAGESPSEAQTVRVNTGNNAAPACCFLVRGYK